MEIEGPGGGWRENVDHRLEVMPKALREREKNLKNHRIEKSR